MMMMMKKMEVVSASLLLLLLLPSTVVEVVSGFLLPPQRHQQQSLHHHNMVSSKDAYDSVQAYNRDSFKSGLKTFLGVPNSSAQQQATTETSSSLDRMTQSVSNFEPTTVVGGPTNQVVAATASNKVSAAAAAAASSPVVTETTTTSSTSATASAATDAALDRLQEAENAISTIREMATAGSGSSIVGSGTRHIDPVVDKTFAELYEKFSHPDQFLDPLHNIGAPPGQGLATPLVDYVTKSLQELQAKQMSYYYRPEVGTPDVRKLSSGLEVKASLMNEIDALQQTSRALSEKLSAEIVSNRHYLAENFKMTMENSALSNDQIKDRLFQSFEAIQATNAKLVERIGSSSSSIEGSAAWASSIHFPTEQFAAVKSNVIHVLQTPGWTVSDLSDALNVKELGAYYTGAVASLLLLVALNEQLSTDPTTVKTTTTTTTVATSSEPVVPPATKTATPPPPPSSSLSAQTKSDAAEKARLEGMVLELTSAVAILTDELKGLKAGKYETDYQLASMKSEVRTVQNEVGRSVAGGPDTMSKLGQSTLKMQELQAQLEAARLEVDTLKEVNDALTESISAIASTSGSEPHPPSSPPPKTLEESSVFFASIVEDELKEVASVAAKKKKEVVPNVAAAVQEQSADEWGNLSLSALKKKPLTEIVDYLQGKGASVTDENGNLLKKSELVQTVLAYA